MLYLLAPHTSGPRDVPRCGALSLLQKTLHYKGVGSSRNRCYRVGRNLALYQATGVASRDTITFLLARRTLALEKFKYAFES